MDNTSINHAINIKNVVEYSKSHADLIGQHFFYADTSAVASWSKYATANLTGNAENYTSSDFANKNVGFRQRKQLLSVGASNNAIIPLNRYGFF